MASRRMFSARIIESTRFLKMSATAQILYIHLAMHADDDGVVEAYPIMRMIGAVDDDLKLIVSRGFATVLNEELITFINDWTEHNNIRADRKTDTIYKDLLLQVVPDANIREAKPTYYSRSKEICQTNDRQYADNTQTNDGIGKVSIGKVSIGKVSIGKYNTNSASNDTQSGSMKDINAFFESIWKLYPNKKGKGQISDTKKKVLYKIGYEELKRAIERYSNDLKRDDWRKPQYGSTFFNSGYVDYLDSNYQCTVAATNQNNSNSLTPDELAVMGQLRKEENEFIEEWARQCNNENQGSFKA